MLLNIPTTKTREFKTLLVKLRRIERNNTEKTNFSRITSSNVLEEKQDSKIYSYNAYMIMNKTHPIEPATLKNPLMLKHMIKKVHFVGYNGPLFSSLPAPPKHCPQYPYYLYSPHQAKDRAIIQLSSFPGSGNTWVRHLLERGTGIATGNIYDADPGLVQFFKGERCKDGKQTIAIKTHYPCLMCFGKEYNYSDFRNVEYSGKVNGYNASIQILRNPFGAILAYFNYLYSDRNHLRAAPEHRFKSQIFLEFVKTKIESWLYHVKYYLHEQIEGDYLYLDSLGRKVYVLRYERLTLNTQAEMKKLFDFIRAFIDPENDVHLRNLDPNLASNCSLSEGYFHRNKDVRTTFNPFLVDVLVNQTTLTLQDYVCSRIISSNSLTWDLKREYCP